MPKKTKAVLESNTCGACIFLGFLNHCSKRNKIVDYNAEACTLFEPLRKYPKDPGYAVTQPFRPVIHYLGKDRARYEADIKRRGDITVVNIPKPVMLRLGLKKGERILISIRRWVPPETTKWEEIPSAKNALAAVQYEQLGGS